MFEKRWRIKYYGHEKVGKTNIKNMKPYFSTSRRNGSFIMNVMLYPAQLFNWKQTNLKCNKMLSSGPQSKTSSPTNQNIGIALDRTFISYALHSLHIHILTWDANLFILIGEVANMLKWGVEWVKYDVMWLWCYVLLRPQANCSSERVFIWISVTNGD